MYMVTPYMEHDLSGLLENPQVRFTVPQIKCYMLQLLRGLKYLHEVSGLTIGCLLSFFTNSWLLQNQILHRDMKGSNGGSWFSFPSEADQI
jgi:serine/threonine protein kinase